MFLCKKPNSGAGNAIPSVTRVLDEWINNTNQIDSIICMP